jgi:hypothetical protein
MNMIYDVLPEIPAQNVRSIMQHRESCDDVSA